MALPCPPGGYNVLALPNNELCGLEPDNAVDFGAHTMHHKRPSCNFGLIGMIDALSGTLCLPGEEASCRRKVSV